MKWNNKTLVLVARILLGLIFVVFGLNGFLQFMSGGPMPEAATAFMGALVASGLIILLKLFEIIIGVLLLVNKATPLAAVMLVPISVNLLYFHAALAPGGIGMALVIALLNLYLLMVYKKKYEPMLSA